MFRVYFTNLFYFAMGEFATLDAAAAEARATGFDATILEDGRPVAAYSVFGGLRPL